MGEYLSNSKLSVKIGTCENLYYTTFSQLKKCNFPQKEHYLNPKHEFRYRFPFPDEDDVKMGHHQTFNRGVLFSLPSDSGIEIAHDEMYFRTTDILQNKQLEPVGIRMTCVQSKEFPFKKMDWHNTASKVIFEVVYQKQADDQLQVVVRCPYCFAECRLDANEAKALYTWANEHGNDLQKEIAKRIMAGYEHPEAL